MQVMTLLLFLKTLPSVEEEATAVTLDSFMSPHTSGRKGAKPAGFTSGWIHTRPPSLSPQLPHWSKPSLPLAGHLQQPPNSAPCLCPCLAPHLNPAPKSLSHHSKI